jgi:hypothetical protein
MSLKAPDLNLIKYQSDPVAPVELRIEPKNIPFVGQLDVVRETEKAGRCINKLSFGSSIADGFESWTNAAFALSELGEPGRSLFHEFSQKSDKYNEKECDKKFTNALKTRDGRINLASFYTLCAQEGALYKDSLLENENFKVKNDPKSKQDNEDINFKSLLPLRFDDRNPIPKPIAVVAIEDSVICTAGNISVVAGPSKSGKSSGGGAILAGALAMPGDIIQEEDRIGIYVEGNENGKGVIHIDSEQSRYDHQRFNNQVLKRCNRQKAPDYYYSFSLQRFTPSELIKATETIFEEVAKRHDGIHLALIDGIGDYVSSVNDELESNAVILLFIQLATKYNIPIILVLHFNPGTEKGRGHIGSHLERKCESFLSFEKAKDSDISTIKPKLLRNAGNFNEIQFEFNKEKGYHTLVAKINRTEAAQEKKNLKLISKTEQYNAILDEAFIDKDKIRNKDLIVALKEYFDIKDRGAENRKEEMISMGLIQLNGTFYKRNKDAL